MTQYVLRLFDRPVNLAKFTNDCSLQAPLYPVCRAWVHGQSSVKVEKEDTNGIEGLPEPRSKAEIIKKFDLAVHENEDVDIRIPKSVRAFKPADNLQETLDKSIDTMDGYECLELNKQHWKKVRKDWSDARRIHEFRYENSFRILQEMAANQQRTMQ